MPLLNWIKKNLSNDPLTSNSRLLQSVIVVNLTIILWLVVAFSNWVITDNVRLVMLCLITSGAGAYITSKIGEKNA